MSGATPHKSAIVARIQNQEEGRIINSHSQVNCPAPFLPLRARPTNFVSRAISVANNSTNHYLLAVRDSGATAYANNICLDADTRPAGRTQGLLGFFALPDTGSITCNFRMLGSGHYPDHHSPQGEEND